MDLGGATDTLPPLAENFFIFIQVLGKNGQIIGWRPLREIVNPSQSADSQSFANNTNLTFLTLIYNIDIMEFQNVKFVFFVKTSGEVNCNAVEKLQQHQTKNADIPKMTIIKSYL